MNHFDLIYTGILATSSPLWVLKCLKDPSFRKEFLVRLIPFAHKIPVLTPPKKDRIWVHAASVGEMLLALKVIQALEKKTKGLEFVLTTNRIASLKLAQAGSKHPCCLAPLDFSWRIKAFIKRTGITGLMLLETEIWPNMIRQASTLGPVSVINGRLSDRHFIRYKKIQSLLASSFAKFNFVSAVDEVSRQRFEELGTAPDAIKSFGNLKFALPTPPDAQVLAKIKTEHGIKDSDFLWVAGSVQPEEVPALAKAYQKAASRIKNLKLILVPRHPAKRKLFMQSLEQAGLKACLDTERKACQENSPKIWLIDRIGVLLAWYGLADAVFVGGSLCERGGQNMIEPAGLAKPVATGPFTANFQAESNLLEHGHGLCRVKDANSLADFIIRCQLEPEWALAMANKAKVLIEAQAGGLKKTLDHWMELYGLE